MNDTKTITNNVPRNIVDAGELTDKERKEFDYLNWAAIDAGDDSASFFRYRGTVYDLGEFMSTRPGPWAHLPADSPLLKWDGYLTDSFFSAIVIKYVSDFEQIIVGLVLS